MKPRVRKDLTEIWKIVVYTIEIIEIVQKTQNSVTINVRFSSSLIHFRSRLHHLLLSSGIHPLLSFNPSIPYQFLITNLCLLSCAPFPPFPPLHQNIFIYYSRSLWHRSVLSRVQNNENNHSPVDKKRVPVLPLSLLNRIIDLPWIALTSVHKLRNGRPNLPCFSIC